MKKVITILFTLYVAVHGFMLGEGTAFVHFSPLDHLGRVGPAYARIGAEYPIGARSSIQHITPTGWQSVSLDVVPGGWLFHRCHLIAHRFSDSDAVENIFTGTQALNVAMKSVENQVAKYVQETRHHVDYVVFPVFLCRDQLCRGVLMMARSVEDDALLILEWIPNAQEGVEIEYSEGGGQYAPPEKAQAQAPGGWAFPPAL